MSAGPAWLGIGAQRCGTTWFASLLTQHPQMDVAEGLKEHHWFYRYGLTQEWTDEQRDEYRKTFSSDNVKLGEFTPYYLRAPWIVEHVAATVPADIPILVLVRDPIDRFASALRLAMFAAARRHKRTAAQRRKTTKAKKAGRTGKIPLRKGLSRTAAELSRTMVQGPPKPPAQAIVHKTWLRYVGSDITWAGMYAAQLDLWTAMFSEDQFMVIQYEKLARDPQHYADLVWKRLGLDPIPIKDRPSRATNKKKSWVPDDHPDVVKGLRQIYRPDAERLASRFDIDLSLWKRTMS